MINVNFQYSPLFTLEVLHDYYQNGGENIFQLDIEPASEAMLNTLGILVRKGRKGWDLLYDVDRAEVFQYLLESEDDISLKFWVYCKEMHLVNFTELSNKLVHEVLFLSNKDLKVQKKTGEEKLHKGEFVSDDDFYPLYASSFTWDKVNSKAKNVRVINDSKEEVFNAPFGANDKCAVDLNYRGGHFQLFEDKKLVQEFVVADIGMRAKPLAVIELQLSGILKDFIIKSLDQPAPIPTQKYKTTFQNRSTYWRYFIVSRYEKPKFLKIQNGSTKVTFKEVETAELPNGETALVMESSAPLSLKEFSPYKFQLKGYQSQQGVGKTLLDIMPVPSVDIIKPRKEEKGVTKVYSEVFIYI